MSMTVLRWLVVTEIVLFVIMVVSDFTVFPIEDYRKSLALTAPLVCVGLCFDLAGDGNLVGRRYVLVSATLLVLVPVAAVVKWHLAVAWYGHALDDVPMRMRWLMDMSEFSLGVVLMLIVRGYQSLPPRGHYVRGQLR